jgi:GLPGLI family protein
MKKIAILIVYTLLITGFTKAQGTYTTIKYLVTDDWVKKLQAVDYLGQKEKDEYQYVWGNRSEYTSKSVLVYNSKASKYEDLKEDNSDENGGYSWRSDEYVIYRNLEENRTYDLMRMLDKLYVIDDTTKYQNWKILNDMREIAGHICMNASWTDTTKNNKVVAWYALDLPISVGPERFGGLPGIILEINVNNGAMIISAESITETIGDTIIEKPVHKRKVNKLTELGYQNLIYEHIQRCKKDEFPYFWGTRY